MLAKKITVIIFFIICCTGYFFFINTSPVQQIKVNLQWHENILGCKSTFDPKNSGEAWFIEQLQFFLSDIEIEVEGQGWQHLQLTKNAFQNSNTVLLGTNCREKKQHSQKNDAEYWSIIFENNVDISKVRSVKFTVGVPFDVNHLNPVSQQSPLNLPSMFWVWQTGHKFIRAEFASVDDQWIFHLGSSGCKAASVMRPPKQKCLYPNTFEFELPVDELDSKALILNFNLAHLLHNVEMSSKANCQSERDNESCLQLFNNLATYNKPLSVQHKYGTFSTKRAINDVKGSEVE